MGARHAWSQVTLSESLCCPFHGSKWMVPEDLRAFGTHFETMASQTSNKLFCTALGEALTELDEQVEAFGRPLGPLPGKSQVKSCESQGCR